MQTVVIVLSLAEDSVKGSKAQEIPNCLWDTADVDVVFIFTFDDLFRLFFELLNLFLAVFLNLSSDSIVNELLLLILFVLLLALLDVVFLGLFNCMLELLVFHCLHFIVL